eukprot:6500606-Heterocapsa_arctica.AAC.1
MLRYWPLSVKAFGGPLEGAHDVLPDLIHVLGGRGGVHHNIRAVRVRPVAPDLTRAVLRPV